MNNKDPQTIGILCRALKCFQSPSRLQKSHKEVLNVIQKSMTGKKTCHHLLQRQADVLIGKLVSFFIFNSEFFTLYSISDPLLLQNLIQVASCILVVSDYAAQSEIYASDSLYFPFYSQIKSLLMLQPIKNTGMEEILLKILRRILGKGMLSYTIASELLPSSSTDSSILSVCASHLKCFRTRLMALNVITEITINVLNSKESRFVNFRFKQCISRAILPFICRIVTSERHEKELQLVIKALIPCADKVILDSSEQSQQLFGEVFLSFGTVLSNTDSVLIHQLVYSFLSSFVTRVTWIPTAEFVTILVSSFRLFVPEFIGLHTTEETCFLDILVRDTSMLCLDISDRTYTGGLPLLQRIAKFYPAVISILWPDISAALKLCLDDSRKVTPAVYSGILKCIQEWVKHSDPNADIGFLLWDVFYKVSVSVLYENSREETALSLCSRYLLTLSFLSCKSWENAPRGVLCSFVSLCRVAIFSENETVVNSAIRLVSSMVLSCQSLNQPSYVQELSYLLLDFLGKSKQEQQVCNAISGVQAILQERIPFDATMLISIERHLLDRMNYSPRVSVVVYRSLAFWFQHNRIIELHLGIYIPEILDCFNSKLSQFQNLESDPWEFKILRNVCFASGYLFEFIDKVGNSVFLRKYTALVRHLVQVFRYSLQQKLQFNALIALGHLDASHFLLNDQDVMSALKNLKESK